MTQTNKSKRLSLEERKLIESLLSEKIPHKELCKKIGINPSTLYREMKKCASSYNAEEAHKNTCTGFHPIDWDIIGKKYGLLTITEYIGIENHRTFWNALCDCGNVTKISRKILGDYCSADRPLSCGCVAKESKGILGQVPFEEACLRKYQDMLAFRRIEGDCWIYTGYIQRGTIPKTSWKNKSMSVRKCMYLLMNATTYEPNAVYGKCKRRFCFNPDHIEIGHPGKNWYID